jgi:5-methylcytosine-specific restriction endonuclease McrA
VLDGQQRITSFGRFVTGKFAIIGTDGVPHYFKGLAEDLRDRIMKAKLTIYVCEGKESEIKAWFKTINIVGKPLNDQEIANATHSGPFVTKAREEFSNSQNANVQKWSAYISGDVKRQDFLKTALEWVSKGNIDAYMSQHRYDDNINELKAYFTSVIDWVSSVFSDVESEMRGLPWGEYYERYHGNSYNPQEVHKKVLELYADYYVKNRKGVYDYILGGCIDTKLIDVRVFDEPTKKSVYAKQTDDAKQKNISNCPMCASSGVEGLIKRLYKYSEMDADHVTAWSKGGATDVSNCQMLCKTHNRSKGNR